MRERRQLGKELIKFIDGTDREINIHAVANFEMMKLRRLNRETKLNKKGEVDKVEFKDEDFVKAILKLATGTQMDTQDWEETENDLKELYDKYFGKNLDNTKKHKLTDIAEQNQDNKSEE